MTMLLCSRTLFFSQDTTHTANHGKEGPRDPGAPKRNMSAYLLYQNAMRETFKAQNPGMTFGQLAKYTSAMYAELSPEEKEAWVAPSGSGQGSLSARTCQLRASSWIRCQGRCRHDLYRTIGKASGQTRARYPMPKRNMSAYLLYQNAMRDQFRRENPGMTFGQLAKYTSAMYKCLTPEEKATWDARASQDKSRFDGEMASYVPPTRTRRPRKLD
jgi:high mobility group protein B1